MPHTLVLHTVVSRGFAQNTFLAGLQGRNDCVIVDPGFDFAAIQNLRHRAASHPQSDSQYARSRRSHCGKSGHEAGGPSAPS